MMTKTLHSSTLTLPFLLLIGLLAPGIGVQSAHANLLFQKNVERPTAIPGDLLTYTLTLRNTGNNPEPNVSVVDTLPAPPVVQFVTGSIIGPVDTATGQINTAATVQTVPAVQQPQGVPGGSPYPGLQIDPNITSITWNIGNVPRNTTYVMRFQVRVAAAPAGTVITNNAQVMQNGAAVGNGTATTTVPNPLQPSVTKFASKSFILPGDAYFYYLVFANPTGVPVTANAQDVLPPELTEIAGTMMLDGAAYPDNQGVTQLANGTFPVNIPAGPGGTVGYSILKFEVISKAPPAQAGRDIQNTVTLTNVKANGANEPNATDTDYVLVGALSFSKTVDKPFAVTSANPAEQGEVLSYTITVDNPTDSDLFNDPRNPQQTPPAGVIDTLDPKEYYVLGSAQGPTGVYFSSGGAYDYIPMGNLNPYGTDPGVRSLYFALGDVPAHTTGHEVTFQARVAPNPPAAPGSKIVNSAQVQGTVGDPRSLPNSGLPALNGYTQGPVTATTTVAQVLLDKSVDKTVALAGDTLFYTLRVINTAGPSTVQDVPDANANTFGGTFLLDGNPAGGAASYGQLTGAGYQVPAGDHTIVFNVTIKNPLAVGTVVQNTAAATVQGQPPSPVQSQTVKTTIGELKLIKTVDRTNAQPGDTLNYTIEVDNPTDSAISMAQITDNIPTQANTGTAYVVDSAIAGPADAIKFTTGANLPGTFSNGQGITDSTVHSITWTFNNVAPRSGPAFLRFAVQVDQKAPIGTALVNQATSTYLLTGSPQQYQSQSNSVTTMISLLEFHKQADKSVILPGDVVTYTLTYQNLAKPDDPANTPAPQAPLNVRDTLGVGQTYVPNTLFIDGVNEDVVAPNFFSAQGTPIPPANNPTDILAPDGLIHTITYQVTTDPAAVAGNTFTNQAFLTPNPGDAFYGSQPIPSETSTITVGQFNIRKDVNNGSASNGAAFTLTVENPTDTALNIVPPPPAPIGGAIVTDPIDPSFSIVPGSVTIPAGGLVQYAHTITPPAQPGQLPTYSAFDQVPAGALAIQWQFPMAAHSGPVQLAFQVGFNNGVVPGTAACNAAWAQPGYPELLPPKDPTVTVLGSPTFSNSVCVIKSNFTSLTFTKTHTTVGPQLGTPPGSVAVPEQQINYALNLVLGADPNNPIPSYVATVVDPLPFGTRFVPGSQTFVFTNGDNAGTTQNPPAEYSRDGGVTWTYVPVAGPDGTDPNVTDIRWRVTDPNQASPNNATGKGGFSVKVSPTAPNGLLLRNQALLNLQTDPYVNPNGNTWIPTNPDEVTVLRGTLQKTVDKAEAQDGDTLIYELNYNFGAVLPNGGQPVYVEDSIPAGTHYLVGSAAPAGAIVQFSNDNGATWTYVPVSDVNGVDVKVTNVRWNIAALAPVAPAVTAPGAGHVSFAVRINLAAADNQFVTNTGIVQLLQNNTLTEFIRSNPANTVIQALLIQKSVDKATADPGDQLNYTLDFANGQPQTLTHALIYDRIPANTAYVVGSAFGVGSIEFRDANGVAITPTPQAGAFNTDPRVALIIWRPGDLVSGARGTVGFSVRVKDNTPIGTVITNQGLIDSQVVGIRPRLSNPATTVIWPLHIIKSVDKTVAPPGGTITYTINYSEHEKVQADKVIILDAIPPNSVYVVGSASANPKPEFSNDGGQTWTYVPVANAQNLDPAVTNIRWQIGSVPDSQGGSVSFQVEILPDTPLGLQVCNTAFETSQVGKTSTPSQGFPSNEVCTLVGIQYLTKTVDKPFALPGEVLHYTISLANLSSQLGANGGQALTNVVVVDKIPNNTLYVDGSASPVIMMNGAVVEPEFSTDGVNWSTSPPATETKGVNTTFPLYIRWRFAKIPVSSLPIIMGFNVRIDDATIPNGGTPPPDGTAIVNIARAGSDQQQQIDSNPAVTIITHLLLVKTVDKDTAVPGDILGYRLEWENRMATALNNVAIEDPIPANTAFVVGSVNAPPDVLTGAVVANGTGVQYSNDGGATWTYVPVANAQGVDPTVTDIRFLLDYDKVNNVQTPFQPNESGGATFQVQINSGDPTATPPVSPPPFGTVITNVAYLMSMINGQTSISQPSNPAITTLSPLRLIKTVDKGNTVLSPNAVGGDILTYSVTALNQIQSDDPNLSVALTNVQVEDPIPGGTQFIVGSATPITDGVIDYSNDGGVTYGYKTVIAVGLPDPNVTNIRWTWNTITPFQTTGNTGTFQVKIIPPATNATGANFLITNQAVGVATYQPGGNPQPAAQQIGPILSNQVSTLVGTTYFVKSVNRGLYVVQSDVLTFNIPFQNFGNADLTNVIVTDTLPSGLIIKSVSINGNPDPRATFDPVTNTATFKLGTVAAGTGLRLMITALVPPTAVPGTEYDNAAFASYDGLTRDLETNVTRSIVVSSIAGGSPFDWTTFHHEQFHSGLDPDFGQANLTQRWTFSAGNGVATGASFVAGPIVLRDVPLEDLTDNQNPNDPGVTRATLAFIGTDEGTTGNFYALFADSQGPNTQNAWAQPTTFDLPIDSTAAVAVGSVGAAPIVAGTPPVVTGVTYLNRTRWCVVVGLGHYDVTNGATGAGAVVCMDGSTGQVIWRYDLSAPVVSSPIIVRNVDAHILFRDPNDPYSALPFHTTINAVYVGCADGYVYAFNLAGAQSPTDDGTVEAQLLWRTRDTSGLNLGSPAAIGTSAVVFGEQIPRDKQTGVIDDFLHAVTSDAQFDANGNPLDAAGAVANPFKIDPSGNLLNDFPVPMDTWPAPGRIMVSTAPDSNPLTESPMVDNQDPTGPVIHFADEGRLIALDGGTGGILGTFTDPAIAAITSTPAIARTPVPNNVTAPPMTMIYFAAINSAGVVNGAATYHNALYALTFSRTANPVYALAPTWAVNPQLPDAAVPNPRPAFNGILALTSSVAAAVDPNAGGQVFVATSTGNGGGRVVSYDSSTGAFTGPITPVVSYGLKENLPNDSQPDEQSSLAVSTIPGSDRPWVFGSTLGGTAFALGVIGYPGTGFLPGIGPPGVAIRKQWGVGNTQDPTFVRAPNTALQGDRMDCTITFGNTGFSVAGAAAAGQPFVPLRGLVVVDEIPNQTDYIPGTATAIHLNDSLQPGAPDRWIIPQLVYNNNRVVQVIWDFRNPVDQYGVSNPAAYHVDLPGGEPFQVGLSVQVRGPQVTLGPTGQILVSTTRYRPGQPLPAPVTNVDYGQTLYVTALGLQVIPQIVPPIQNIVEDYADNAANAVQPIYDTIPDPDAPQGPVAQPLGGVAPFPAAPPLAPAPQTWGPNTIAPFPPNLIPPPPSGLYRPGLYPGTPAPPHPQFYAARVFTVDNDPNLANVQVYFRLMRYTPEQAFFTPNTYTQAEDIRRYQMAWEPAEQVVGLGFVRNARVDVATGVAYPQTRRGREDRFYVVDTRDPNIMPQGQPIANGALSPSPLIDGQSYTAELWTAPRSLAPVDGPQMGFVAHSNFFGVNNPIMVSATPPPLAVGITPVRGEENDANGDIPTKPIPNANPNNNLPGTVIEVGSVQHNRTSQPQPFFAWDNSVLPILKPSTFNRRGNSEFFAYANFSNAQVKIARPDKVAPQPQALHTNFDNSIIEQTFPNDFYPNPNWHPGPWNNGAATKNVLDPYLNPLKNPDNSLFRIHDFMDGYPDILPNGLSTNQYHWDVNTGRYLFDAATNDPIGAGYHYITYPALQAQLGLTPQAAKTLFDQDFPGIPGRNERWQVEQGDPTLSPQTLPGRSFFDQQGNPLPNGPTVNVAPAQYGVQVPQYQADNDLSPAGHNIPNPGGGNPDDPNGPVAQNDWYGYLGRAYLYMDVRNDGMVHTYDAVLASPDTFGYKRSFNGNLRNNYNNIKLNTYEDPYRTLDMHNGVPADLSFNYVQKAINLKQFPHGASDLAQQARNGGADAGLPNSAWSAFDVVNNGNVNLVAVAPWHWDSAAQQWHIMGQVFGAARPFFSDNLYGLVVGGQPLDPQVFMPRTSLWWSMKPRGYNGGNDLAYVGKLPKAQPGAPFPTTLSGVPGNGASFQPWLGTDIPVGQPVGSYENKNVLLREPNPNRKVIVQPNGTAITVPPDRLGNPDPNAQIDTPNDYVDSIGVLHPITSTAPLDLTSDVEEAEPATAPLVPSDFNAAGFNQAGTVNHPVGNDDSAAMVAQSESIAGGPPGITTSATDLFLYWTSNRSTNPANLFRSAVKIPYDLTSGTFGSTFGTGAADWADPGLGGLLAVTGPGVSPELNAVTAGVVAQPSGLPPGFSPGAPAFVSYQTSGGTLWAWNPNGAPPGTPLTPASPFNQSPRLIYEGLNGQPVVGALAFGNLSGRNSINYTPVNPNNVAVTYVPFQLTNPGSLTNVRDPSAAKMLGQAHLVGGTAYPDYEAVAFAGTSSVDHQTSIYASRYNRVAQIVNNVYPLDPTGGYWPRVGLSVALRVAISGAGFDAAHGELLAPNRSGLLYGSHNPGWGMPIPPVPQNGGQPYPANQDYTDWPQLMLVDLATSKPVAAGALPPGPLTSLIGALTPYLTPPLSKSTRWFYDSNSHLWLLQSLLPNSANQIILTLDPDAGTVRFAEALPTLANGDPIGILADYTPRTLRLTSAQQVDTSPVILMDDTPDILGHPTKVTPGGDAWAGPVSRHTMWVVWRRNNGAGNAASTLYYTAYRLQLHVPVPVPNNALTGAPDIQVYYAPGGVVGGVVPANLWGIQSVITKVDPNTTVTDTWLWFDSSLENQDIQVTVAGNTSFFTTVNWQPAIPETPVHIQGVVNEGQPSAYIEAVRAPIFDPVFSLPLDAGTGLPTTANVSPLNGTQLTYDYPKLWIFWSSTRTGSGGPNGQPNTDLFYESIVPRLVPPK